ncbi:hypothetical protein HGRIS_011872 [Hohenbuehelia grisea]|uniref:CCZ1/INTU/HSP4 first Longin domain-containing protein n=1 Tax=Hohenbuehelia grisea TaxID=104357 RepID=A0ABR3JXV0_9AGAR
MTSRIPPNLLYISIYNPTLQPTGPVSDGDDDAEEQAHILFYTAKERAVSRDRMLRQIGLSKALVNFSAMFNSDEDCNNIHSLTRRIVVVSPEPDFWIHACVELAKTPKPSRTPDKGKSKHTDKGKGSAQAQVTYDYHDSSVHDLALREDMLRGYEKFKLLHGSFTSILSNLGREALELQLERFWTVWAWSWYIEGGFEFGEHLGATLHPLYQHIQPALDQFTQELSQDLDVVAIIPPCVIPSTSYADAIHPNPLLHHLLTLIKPREPPSDVPDNGPVLSLSTDDTVRPSRGQPEPGTSTPIADSSVQNPNNGAASNFLAGMNMSAMNIGVSKWTWPGYLTFGKSSNKKPPERPSIDSSFRESESSTQDEEARPGDKLPDKPDAPGDSSVRPSIEAAVNSDGNLTETINSELQKDLASNEEPGNEEPSTADVPPSDVDLTDALSEAQLSEIVSVPPSERPSSSLSASSTFVSPSDNSDAAVTPSPSSSTVFLVPSFQRTTVHLSVKELGSLATRKRTIYYLSHPKYQISLAFIGLDSTPLPDEYRLDTLAGQCMPCFQQIQDILDDEMLRSTVDLLPSATKILQGKDRHIVVTRRGFALGTPGFISRSEHLFHAQALHESDLDITEVFSRGQNPQQWHIGRRGLANGSGENGNREQSEGSAFLEVFRKEASLADVDNTLAGIIRKVI